MRGRYRQSRDTREGMRSLATTSKPVSPTNQGCPVAACFGYGLVAGSDKTPGRVLVSFKGPTVQLLP